MSNNSFAYFPGSSSASQPTVSFKIPNILSGKYDIYAVMVPLNMDKKTQSVEETKRNHFSASIVYDYNDRNGRDIEQAAVAEDGSKEFETRAGVIDSVLLSRTLSSPMLSRVQNPAIRSSSSNLLYVLPLRRKFMTRHFTSIASSSLARMMNQITNKVLVN